MMRQRASRLHGGEAGQMAVAMTLTILIVFAFFALAFDAGLWYFDHRTAQNQAEAAALAAAQELPASSTSAATAAADQWLVKNGSNAGQRSCLDYSDTTGDGKFDTVKVCVRRESNGIFSALSGIDFVHVSASATAMAGPVDSANVMPWAVVPPDPACGPETTRNCHYDANGDGDYTDPGDCDAPFTVCPFGLTADRLYGFKSGGGGNTGIIDACGNGADGYRDCLTGDDASGFTVAAGGTVVAGLQGGNLGTNTNRGLSDRLPAAAWSPPNACDVVSMPSQGTPPPPGAPSAQYPQSPGYDPAGKAAATARFDSGSVCAYRLVLVPILASLPSQGGGSAQLTVLGVATFGVAKWNRSDNKNFFGATGQECATYQGGQEPTDKYSCGMVWGYLFSGVTPPDVLLDQIGDTNNPFAPILVALVD